MDRAAVKGVRGLTDGLDPDSTYLTPELVKAFESGSPASQVRLVIRAIQAVGLALDVVEVEKDPFAEIFDD